MKDNMTEKEPIDAMRQATEDWKSNESQTNAKLEINRIIWQYGPPTMTLYEAEQFAIEFWNKLIHNEET